MLDFHTGCPEGQGSLDFTSFEQFVDPGPEIRVTSRRQDRAHSVKGSMLICCLLHRRLITSQPNYEQALCSHLHRVHRSSPATQSGRLLQLQRKLLASLALEPLESKMAAARTSGNEMHAPKPAKLNMLTIKTTPRLISTRFLCSSMVGPWSCQTGRPDRLLPRPSLTSLWHTCRV